MSGSAAAFVPQRILIVQDAVALASNELKADLERVGYAVTNTTGVIEAVETFAQHQPDLVVIDIKQDDVVSLSLLGQFSAIRRCPVIVISESSDPQLVQQAGNSGVFGYLLKPIHAEALAAQIVIAMQRFSDQENLIREKESLAQNLENRKLIEKAKGILMRLLKLSESDAHRRLQQESQKRRISVVELARKIIESENILGSS